MHDTRYLFSAWLEHLAPVGKKKNDNNKNEPQSFSQPRTRCPPLSRPPRHRFCPGKAFLRHWQSVNTREGTHPLGRTQKLAFSATNWGKRCKRRAMRAYGKIWSGYFQSHHFFRRVRPLPCDTTTLGGMAYITLGGTKLSHWVVWHYHTG